MTRSISFALMIGVSFLLISVAISQPTYISDHNLFLKEFVGSNLLAVLGVILAITLASSAQLHLEFNKTEERHGKIGFRKSRESIRGANLGLIVLFVMAVVTLIIKGVVAKSDESQAILNAVAVFILFLNIILLVELTQAAFSIKAHVVKDPIDAAPQDQVPPNTPKET